MNAGTAASDHPDGRHANRSDRRSASFLDEISVLVLTHDEEANIGRTLAALERFGEIVVLDSESTDETAAIVARFANARLVRRRFDGHAAQWNLGLMACGIGQPWVLALDADYVLGKEAVEEIAALAPAEDISGYCAGFAYCIDGRRLRAALYPPHVVLFRRERAHYVQAGHTQRLLINGRIEVLSGTIDHDDRKPWPRWRGAQQRYAALEARHLLRLSRGEMRLSDRLRRMGWAAPLLVLPYVLLGKGCLLDGRAGLAYAWQRTIAEAMIAREVWRVWRAGRRASRAAAACPQSSPDSRE